MTSYSVQTFHTAFLKIVYLKITFSRAGLVRDSLCTIKGSKSSEVNFDFAILASIWFATQVLNNQHCNTS